MPNADNGNSWRTSPVIAATRESLYRAFLDPAALETWQAPGEATGTVHTLDARVGGGYPMSLAYPAAGPGSPGKSTDREDRYTARFLDLEPPARIVEATTFETAHPAFAGEMIMTVIFDEVAEQRSRSASRTSRPTFVPRTMTLARGSPWTSKRATWNAPGNHRQVVRRLSESRTGSVAAMMPATRRCARARVMSA